MPFWHIVSSLKYNLFNNISRFDMCMSDTVQNRHDGEPRPVFFFKTLNIHVKVDI